MQGTKLIQLLSTFSKGEIKEFEEFVLSPLFNKNKNIIKLCKNVVRCYPNFKSKVFTEKKLFSNIFPGEQYDYFKMKNYISDLFALGIEYLKFKSREPYTYNEDIGLLSQLRKRGLYNFYEKEFAKTQNKLSGNKVIDDRVLYDSYLIEDERLSYISTVNPNTGFAVLQCSFDNFFNYSLIRLLKFYNLMLHEKRQNNVSFDMKMFREALIFLENYKANIPTLDVYRYIILLETEKKEEHYFSLKKVKSNNYHILNEDDLYMANIHMSGFCAYMYNVKGDTGFIRETFLLYQEWLESGLLSRAELLYPDFLNFVKVSVRADEFEFAENFIETQKNSLPEEEKGNCLNFCYGLINYKRKRLETALDMFSKINFSNFILKLQVRLFQLQIFYEMGLYEQVRGLIDSYRHFLAREKSITGEYRESIYEYLRITAGMIELNENLKDADYERNTLKNAASKMPANPFGIKLWLKEMLSN